MFQKEIERDAQGPFWNLIELDVVWLSSEHLTVRCRFLCGFILCEVLCKVCILHDGDRLRKEFIMLSMGTQTAILNLMFSANLSLGCNCAEFPYFYLKPPAGQCAELATTLL
jgi:hypothetical protein